MATDSSHEQLGPSAVNQIGKAFSMLLFRRATATLARAFMLSLVMLSLTAMTSVTIAGQGVGTSPRTEE